MIKIKPFFTTDAAQVRALLRHQDEPVPYESFCHEDKILESGLKFWQHWLPCNLHIGPSVYIAKEDGVVLGLISLDNLGKSNSCWRINQLVVHKSHRGRGIAQELLRYALALFGGQGINHFIFEIANQNEIGLHLLKSCGFRMCTQSNYYQVPLDYQPEEEPDLLNRFRIAQPKDKELIFDLHQGMLPQDVKRIFDHVPDDYYVPELNADTFEKMTRRLMRRKRWFWVADDEARGIIPCAAKISTHRQGEFHIEIYVNQGWDHMTPDVINFVLSTMKRAGMKGTVVLKAYEFQKSLIECVEKMEIERIGTFFLMAREHWQRAKKPKNLKTSVTLPNIGGTPAVNIPFAGGFERSKKLFDLSPLDFDKNDNLKSDN